MADVTDADFQTAVIERSHTVPVVVDLWAPWCGPCKTLGPILEKVIGETQGLVEFAKVNVDENPQVSQAFQVQSIPAVYALKDGQVIDGFMGAQPESEVVAFVQRVLNASAGEPGDGESVVDDNDGASVPDGADAVGEPVAVEEPPAPLDPADASAIIADLEELLPRVKGDDEAREQYLALLDKLGVDHPDTNTYRRRLATALF